MSTPGPPDAPEPVPSAAAPRVTLQPERRPGPESPWVAGRVVGAFAFMFAVLVLYSGIGMVAVQAFPSHLRSVILLAQLGGLALPAIVFRRSVRLRGIPIAPREVPAARLRTHLVPILLVAVLGSGVASAMAGAWTTVAYSQGWTWMLEWSQRVHAPLAPLFDVHGVVDVLLTLALVSLVPATCEELVFRGTFQAFLATVISPRTATGLAAMLFAAFHVDPLGFPSQLFLGVSIGIVYHRTQSLVAAGLLHGLNNACFAALFLATRQVTSEAPPPPLGSLVVILPVLAVAAGGWWVSMRAIPVAAPGVPPGPEPAPGVPY